jgi:hypothetical protein
VAYVPWGAAAVELVKNAKPTAGALLLACFGVYGGALAARFMHPFDVIASAICALALFNGVLLAIIAAIPPVFRSWSHKEAASGTPAQKRVEPGVPNIFRRR